MSRPKLKSYDRVECQDHAIFQDETGPQTPCLLQARLQKETHSHRYQQHNRHARPHIGSYAQNKNAFGLRFPPTLDAQPVSLHSTPYEAP